MKRIRLLMVFLPLFALILRGDTIELKTGEHIDGAFKQATAAGAVIEVAGQLITIPLEKVKAIYFGVAPTRAGPAASVPPVATQAPTREGQRDSAPARPPSDEAEQAIRFAVLEKRFMPADPDSNQYQARIMLKCGYENVSARDIRAFTGTAIFQDLIGREIYRVGVTISDPIKAGQQATWDGVVNYNQFFEEQQRFRAAELRDMQVVWVPISVIFSDEAARAASSSAPQAPPAARFHPSGVNSSAFLTLPPQEQAAILQNGETIVVQSAPAGASISVGGDVVAKTPVAFALHTGEKYSIAVALPGYKPVTQEIAHGSGMVLVQLEPDGSTTANLALGQLASNSEAAMVSPAAAAALASVGRILSPQELSDLVEKGQASRCAVVTVPSGAEVYVDGNKIGVSPVAFVLLKQGDTSRSVTIKMTGYKTVEKAFVPDGKTIPIGLALEKQ